MIRFKVRVISESLASRLVHLFYHYTLNHAVMSLSQGNKGVTPVSCAAHEVAPHGSFTPPNEQSAS